MAEISGHKRHKQPPDVGLTVAPAGNEVEATSERLRIAFKQAGGRRRVSERTRIPERRLGSYLSGQMMKQDALVAIADGCGVRVEWLATGRGPMVDKPDMPDEFKSPFAEWPREVPTPNIIKWTFLSHEDASILSSALSTAHAIVSRGGEPVNAGLLLSALSEFYAVFVTHGGAPQRLAAEVGRLSAKYSGLAKGTADAPAPPPENPSETR